MSYISKCGNCKYFERHFTVKPKKISQGLTQMGGVYGYCRAYDEQAVTVPVWMIDLLRAAEPPLTTEDYGQFCPIWKALGKGDDQGDPKSAEHA